MRGISFQRERYLVAILSIAAGFLVAVTHAAKKPAATGDSLEDNILNSVDDDLSKAGATGGYRIEVVGPDGKSIEGKRYVRGIPGQMSVSEFPHVFVLEGKPLFTAGIQLSAELKSGDSGAVVVTTEKDPDAGDAIHYRAASTVNVSPGRYAIGPMELGFEANGADLKAIHPALSAAGKTLRIHCVPVTFSAVDAGTGSAVPLRDFSLSVGATDLLENLTGVAGRVAFNPLTIYLPRGASYGSSLGAFSIDDAGKIIPGNGTAETFKDGGFVQRVPSAKSLAQQPVGKGYWLSTFNGRRVLKRGEAARFIVIASSEPAAATLPVMVKRSDGTETPLGTLSLPGVAEGTTDSRLMLIDTSVLSPGKYELTLKHPAAHPFAFEIAEILKQTPLELFTLNSTGESSYGLTTDGLDQLQRVGIRWCTNYGHGGMLNPVGVGKTPYPSAPADAPPELKRSTNTARALLDDAMRRGLLSIGYENRRDGWYNQGLAFHHSHPMSVDRMVRRVQIFGQELEDYPAYAGISYTWFPQLGGYTEAGVPSDPFFGTRMEILNRNVTAKTGFEPTTGAEWDKWWKGVNAGEFAPRAGADKLRNFWRAQQRMGWRDTFALYNEKFREVRPDFLCTTADNAGHDEGKLLAEMAGAHDFFSSESYTDFGDWYMSSGFVSDWDHGQAPGKPMWLQVDPSNTEPSMAARLIWKLARGTEGIGIGVNDAGGERANLKRAKVVEFLKRYGSLVGAYEPDNSVAVLVNQLQPRYLYQAHALHSHLTRLGYGPQIISEQTIEKGVPAGVKVICIPNLNVPFSDECDKSLADFVSKGGKILRVGEKNLPIGGATELKIPLKQMWDVGGFSAYLPFAQEFKKVRPALEKQMAALGFAPPNGAEPERAIIVPMKSGGVRYVAVMAFSTEVRDMEYAPATGLSVKVGDAKQVMNLITGESLPVTNGMVKLDLVGEPVGFLSLLSDTPREVVLRHPAKVSAGETIELSCDASGVGRTERVPVELSVFDSAGKALATFYRLSGDKVNYAFAVNQSGPLAVRATELLTGLSSEAKISVAPAAELNVLRSADPVYLPHPDRIERFMKRTGEVRVIIEDAQGEPVAADAQKVVDALTKAGRKASLQRVGPASFDTLWMRWYPGKVEEKVLSRIDAGEVVGYRGNMKPYINTAMRVHVPEKGGYAELTPAYVVRNDTILFSGGQIAESLREISDWMPTPNMPGKGQGVIEVSLSPFWASRDAITVVSNDDAGRAGAVARLVELIASPEKIQGPASFATAKVISADTTTSGSARMKLETPLKGFVPPALAERVVASPAGYTAVAGKSSLAIFSPDGKRTAILPKSDLPIMMSASGTYIGGTFDVTQTDPSWHFPTAWNLTLHVASPGAAPAQFTLTQSVDWMGDRFKGWDRGYAISPDGRTFFAGGPQGSFQLIDLQTGRSKVVRDPADAIGFSEQSRVPCFISSAKFSGNGKAIVFTMANYPSGYGAMGNPPPNPFSTSIRVVSAETGETIWRRDTLKMNDSSLAAVGDALAISLDARRVAYIDWNQNAVLLDENGKDLYRKQMFDWKVKYDYRANPQPLRAELTSDGSTALFASDGNVLLVDAAGKPISNFGVPALCDIRIAADGSKVFAADVDGLVHCFDAAGKSIWEMQTEGERPRLSISGSVPVIAEGAGNLLRLDGAGKVIGKTSFRPDDNLQPVTLEKRLIAEPTTYREPQTLGIVQKLGGKVVVAWKPADPTTSKDHFGRTFYPVTRDVALATPNAAGRHVVHLVYRHAGGKGAAVRVDDGQHARTFVLDLPTPEYRVVDLPCEPKAGGKIDVTIAKADGLEIAELSIHSFKFPGNNILYIAPPDAGTDRPEGLDVGEEPTKKKTRPTGLDPDLLDDKETSKASAGKMKVAAIFAGNPDPDQVEGHYLRATGNPLEAFDGRRFDDGTGASAWTSGIKGTYGSRIFIELPFPAKPKICATYERTLVQSKVMKSLAVLRGKKSDNNVKEAGPDNLNHERRALAGLFDNDQFFNLFNLAGSEMDAFGLFVFSGRGVDHGLSEVELYQ